MKLLDKIRGKTGGSYSLAKLLYRDTIIVVSSLVLFLVVVVFLGLYLNYKENLDTYSKEYVQDVRSNLKLTVEKTIKQANLLSVTLTQKSEQAVVDNVGIAYSVAKSIYETSSKKESKNIIINKISNALKSVKLNEGAGYFFVIRASDGLAYMHGADSRFEGKGQLSFKNEEGRFIIREMLELAKKQDSGFLNYKFKHPNRSLKDSSKVTFIKVFKPLNIIIGTGYYLEDIENKVKADIKKYILELSSSGDNYIWVMDSIGTVLVHKYAPQLVGKSAMSIKDSDGVYITRSLLERSVQSGEAYLQYKWLKPSLGEHVDKISYGKRHDHWGWMFVTGSYIDDIVSWENRRRREFTIAFVQQIFLTLVVAIALVFVLSIIVKRNFSKLNAGFTEFNRFFENPSKSLSDGDWKDIPYEEFQLLSHSTQVISEYHKMLKDEKNKAEDALKARNEFINNMSHEIRTPMNVIIGMADILDETKMNLEQRKFLDSFQDACTNLLTLLNDILDLSKLESQTFELENSSFDLKEKLSKTVELFKHGAERKELDITLNFGEDIEKHVIADQVRLGQVISNLIGNSIKFTQFGHVDLNVSLINKDAGMQVLRFSVYDTGIGIEKESVDRIFSKFMQADSSVTRRYGGTGLGLSISKRIVDAFGGELRVESEPAKYTEFLFEIPLKIDTSINDSQTVKSKTVDITKIRKGHILVVDDTEDNILLIKKFLEHPDLKISTADNGIEAIEKYKTSTFDLILMDIQMPVMDGHEATRRIRELEKLTNDHVPIYALTAYAMVENINKSLAAGCDGHISKPIRKKDIQSFIFGMLAREDDSN